MTGDDGSFYDDRPDEVYGARCADDDHAGCSHAPFLYALGQVDPESRRAWSFDAQESEVLCRCACHRDCPLATEELSIGKWLSRCTCNGALQMIDRHRRMPPSAFSGGPHKLDLSRNMREAFDKTRRKRTARRAAEERARGLTVDEVERIVQEEWGRQGLDVPPLAIAKRIADEIVHPPGVVERVAQQARLYRDLAGLPVRLRRVTRGGLPHTLERIGRKMGGAFIVATGQELVEIPLDADALDEATDIAGRAVFFPSTMTATRVEARLASDGRVEVWPYPSTGPSDRALGVVPPGEAGRLAELIAIATRVDQPCVCSSAFVRARDGGWQLFINRPLQRVA
jgi:hypothetical protein